MMLGSTLGSWMLRIVAWDGMLPAAIWFAPLLIQAVAPNRRGAVELAAVFLPIFAFFIRFRAGNRYISTNNCGPALRGLQFCVFFLAIFVLVLVDAVIMLTHVMPRAAITVDDLKVFAALYGAYLATMAFAMYPGFGAARKTHLLAGS
jgi:hypothetical protein